MGVELESYSIQLPDYRISRELVFPRKGVGEAGEGFGRDASIGTEYRSRPFSTVREGFFLLKAGLRKYVRELYRERAHSSRRQRLLLVGGWRDRFAGAHLHMSVAGETLTRERARRLAWHLHDHLPLVVALTANSPVWGDELTDIASNRTVLGSKKYFTPVARRRLRSRTTDEITLNRGRKTKPPTLEIRIMDSNLPEFVMAAATLLKAAALGCLEGQGASNVVRHSDYLLSRLDAAKRGMRAKLCWNGRWLSAPQYLDRFIWVHREALSEMDVPEDVWTTLKLCKRGWNGSHILHEAAALAHEEHPQTWQRRFAKRYAGALSSLLSGNSLLDFIQKLSLEPPNLGEVSLGRRGSRLG